MCQKTDIFKQKKTFLTAKYAVLPHSDSFLGEASRAAEVISTFSLLVMLGCFLDSLL